MFILLLLFLTGCLLNKTSEGGRKFPETINNPSKEGFYIVKKDKSGVTVVSAESEDFSDSGGEKEFYQAVVYSNVSKNVKIGQRVQIENDGPILESYPAQGKAKATVLLPTYHPEGADLTEAQVVRKALNVLEEKFAWVPIIREVVYHHALDNWEIKIQLEEVVYKVEIQDK